MKSFLEIFLSERIRAQSCNRVQNSVLPCNISTIEIVFASDVLASPILHPHRFFFSDEFRSIM